MAQTRNRSDGLTEQIVSDADIENMVVSWILYGVEGVILTVTNFPIVLVVLVFAKLRRQKEFIIIAALAFADGIVGFGYLVAAVGRLSLLYRGNAFVLITRWQCYMNPWILLWIWAQPAGVVMLVVISLDRLLAVSIPLRYYFFTARYAYTLVGVAYAIVIPPIIWSLVDTYKIPPIAEVPSYCSVGHNFIAADHPYFSKFLLFGTSTSVTLYVPVILLLLKITLTKSRVADNASKFETLKRATVTLGISTLCTFTFYILPMIAISLKMFTNLNVFYLMLNLNAMVNIFIYIVRFKEIRAGLKALLTCSSKVTWEEVHHNTNRIRPALAPNTWGSDRISTKHG